MNTSIANLVYAFGAAGLFYLNRDKSIRTSGALWLPVIYLWILGSRPISFWLGVVPKDDIMLDGSPIDEAFFLILLIGALCVVVQRKHQAGNFLRASGPMLSYFLFCLFSVLWSDFPGVACKRWFKSIEDLLMILIVLTDKQPAVALSRLFSRAAFILVPFSLLFIKYYPDLGRSYDPWTGRQVCNGLATDKNMLGVVTYVLLLGAVWHFLALLRADKSQLGRGRHLFAQGTLLAAGIYLLSVSDSITSTVAFALGTVLMLVTGLPFMKRHVAAIHAFTLFLVISVSAIMFLGGGKGAIQALGRDSTFSGRTDIWKALVTMAPNPVIGAGFESFWLSRSVRTKLAAATGGQDLNEAHDGYLEVYLELGWLGVALIAFMLLDGYSRAIAAFRRNPEWGSLLLAFIVSTVVYNLTEAGFRMMDPIWIFLLFAIIASGGIASGIVAESSKSSGLIANPARRLAKNKRIPTRDGIGSM